ATARLNCGCAAAVHEVAKTTVPSFSVPAGCSCCWAFAPRANVSATTNTAITDVIRDMNAVFTFGPMIVKPRMARFIDSGAAAAIIRPRPRKEIANEESSPRARPGSCGPLAGLGDLVGHRHRQENRA